MAEVASAYVSLIPSFRGGEGAIAKELGGAGKSGGAAASKGFKGAFLPGLKSLAGPVAGLFAASGAVGFLKDANAEARDAQKVGALTTSTIKATGRAAGVTAKQVGDLAGAISTKTGIDDETIQSGQNMLLTFKNIRNEAGKGNDIFDQSTKALIDMSSAMGTEPKQAAIQLGKALNDPVKGATALSRAGVQFTDVQKDQIKQMVKTGDTMGAQKLILAELTSQFGGAAEAQATAGDKAAVAWGNLKEQIGTALLPVIDKMASVFTSDVVPAVSEFITQMQTGKGAGGEFADVLSKGFNAVKSAVSTVGPLVMDVIGFLVDNKEAVGTFAGILLSVATAVKVWTTAQIALNVALTANPIGIVVVAIAALAAGLVMAYKKSETFRNIVNGAFNAIATAAKWLWNNALQPTIKFIVDGYGMVFEGIAKVLDALSHVPGFGWAKKAADMMHNAADKAHEMADAIRDIPDKKTVTVAMSYTAANIPAAIQGGPNGVPIQTFAPRDVPGDGGGGQGARANEGSELRGTLRLEGSEAHIEGVTRKDRARAGRAASSDGRRRP